MGKDGDGAGKDALKAEHAFLVTRENNLNNKCEEVKALFKSLEEAYSASKESFSLNRYGKLKDMIKAATTDEVVNGIREASEPPKSGQSGKSGMAGLLRSAKEFSSGAPQQQEASQQEPAAKPNGKDGKMSSFMKKFKKMTGFSDEPITDEDVMSASELERDNGRKNRAISRHSTQLAKDAARLEKLKQSYQASKSHAPPKRYQELKNMIKDCIAGRTT